MRIVCPQCGAKYEVKDEKVRKKVFKIRCKRCSHEFVVRGEQEEAQAATPEPEAAAVEQAAPSEDEATKVVDYSARQREIAEEEGAVWHVVINREQVGGLTAQDVLAYLGRGEIDADTFTWREGMADWARLSAVPEFADAVAAATSQAGPVDDEDPGATAAIDVSGGLGAIASPPAAEAEEDVMASNNVADGTAGGLFGGIDDIHDPRVTDPSQLRNQRNENSVLFSLDALAEGAGAGPAAPSPSVSNTGGSEASGLIDMSLLDNFENGPATSTQSEMDALFGAGSGPAAAMPVPSGAPIAPLVAAKKSKIPMILGIAAGVVILVGGTVAVMMTVMDKGSETAVTAEATKPAAPSTFKIGGDKKAPKATPAATAAAPAPSGEAAKAPAPAAAEEKVAANEPAAQQPKKAAAKSASKRSGTSTSKKKRKTSKSSSSSSVAARTAPKVEKPAPKPKPKKRPKSSGDSSEVDDLLGALSGKPAAKPSGGGSRRPPAGGGGSSSPADDPMLPDKLSRNDVMPIIRRATSKIRNCRGGSGSSGTVKVRVTVSGSGRVQKASLMNFQDDPVGRCVLGKVKGLRFPRFRQGSQSFTLPFKL